MKQIIVGICDDQPEVLQELQKMLSEICKEKAFYNELCTFTDGYMLLEQIEKFQIVFLDIEMPQIDGIELGKRIKERNPKCKLIMATGVVERFKEAFQIQAFRFVTKPFVKEEVKEALEAAAEGFFLTRSVEVYADRSKYEFSEEEIVYIKAYDSYAEIYIGKKKYRKNCSLDELEDTLTERLFIRINREMIVNLRWVQQEEKGTVKIKNELFQISRRRRREFEQKFIEFDLKYRKVFEE